MLLDAGVMVRDCSRLHAKAYVVGDDFAMIGSGNLTNAGLGESRTSNLELSVVVPSSEVGRVQFILDRWWDESADVEQDEIEDLKYRVSQLPRPPRRPREKGPAPRASTELAEVVEQILGEARGDDVELWIKAVHGTPDAKDWEPEGWFSSHNGNRPAFRPGDLVLLYSKEQHGCMGVLEVLDEPRFDPDFVAGRLDAESGHRWPWVNTAQPRLMPYAPVVVPGAELGVKTQGLQAGRMRVPLTEFATGVQALASGCQAATPEGTNGFLG